MSNSVRWPDLCVGVWHGKLERMKQTKRHYFTALGYEKKKTTQHNSIDFKNESVLYLTVH